MVTEALFVGDAPSSHCEARRRCHPAARCAHQTDDFWAAICIRNCAAAILALLALTALRTRLGIALVWVFNIWGSLDLLNAFYQANGAGLSAGQLGATYFIPTMIVPLLLITHGLVFRILLLPAERLPRRENPIWQCVVDRRCNETLVAETSRFRDTETALVKGAQ